MNCPKCNFIVSEESLKKFFPEKFLFLLWKAGWVSSETYFRSLFYSKI